MAISRHQSLQRNTYVFTNWKTTFVRSKHMSITRKGNIDNDFAIFLCVRCVLQNIMHMYIGFWHYYCLSFSSNWGLLQWPLAFPIIGTIHSLISKANNKFGKIFMTINFLFELFPIDCQELHWFGFKSLIFVTVEQKYQYSVS